MKKIHFLLFATILLGFVWNQKASGQSCDKCLPGTICIPLTFSIGNCDNVMVTLCVRCGATNPTIYWRSVQYDNICPCYEFEINRYVENWIANHTLEICGNRPCQEEPAFTVYFEKPLCGDVYWDGQRYHISRGSAMCENSCLDERWWCWCDCINEPGHCWDEECIRRGGFPYFRYQHIRYSETNPGACEFVPYGNKCPGSKNPFIINQSWPEPLRCVQIIWDLENCDTDCQD